MTLELDPRIKDRKFIFDCFNADEAKKYIGKECYLTDWLAGFGGVEILKIGKLTAINANGLFFCGSDAYTYCLPVEFVAPKEKKYRPYTLEEFTSKFIVGGLVKFRPKDEPEVRQCLVLLGYKCTPKYTFIYIGNSAYTLNDLFNHFEWYDDNAGQWKPFGIPEEDTPEAENE